MGVAVSRLDVGEVHFLASTGLSDSIEYEREHFVAKDEVGGCISSSL